MAPTRIATQNHSIHWNLTARAARCPARAWPGAPGWRAPEGASAAGGSSRAPGAGMHIWHWCIPSRGSPSGAGPACRGRSAGRSHHQRLVRADAAVACPAHIAVGAEDLIALGKAAIGQPLVEVLPAELAGVRPSPSVDVVDLKEGFLTLPAARADGTTVSLKRSAATPSCKRAASARTAFAALCTARRSRIIERASSAAAVDAAALSAPALTERGEVSLAFLGVSVGHRRFIPYP